MNLQEMYGKACEIYGVKKEDLFGASRKAPIAETRMLIATKLRKAGFTYQVIGDLLNRDKATVYDFIKSYKGMISVRGVPRKAVELMQTPFHPVVNVRFKNASEKDRQKGRDRGIVTSNNHGWLTIKKGGKRIKGVRASSVEVIDIE